MTTDAVQPWMDADRIREEVDRLEHRDFVPFERYEDRPPPHGPPPRPKRTPRGFFDRLRRVPPHSGRSKKNAARKGDGGP